MKATDDIGYQTFLLMLAVFVGLALLSNFTSAANAQDFTESELTTQIVQTKNIQP